VTNHDNTTATRLTELRGVGPALAKKLGRLGVFAIEDLLFLLPLRYEDRTQLVKLGALATGERCLVTGEVLLSETVYRGRRSLLIRLGDGSGQLTLRFFHFSRAQQAQFQPGVHVTCFGEARKGSAGLEMIHPEYRVLRKDQDPAINDSLTAIYPATEGVQQGRLRNLTDQALQIMQRSPPRELLPADVIEQLDLPPLAKAIVYLHRPPPDADVELMLAGQHPCQQRLAFEELLAHYLSLKSLRALADTETAPALTDGEPEVAGFVRDLAYELTAAQRKVVDEILGDLSQPHPMMRLIQGDVGSGKTVVAAIACLKAISCGVQAAIMAPTEILARQHFHTLTPLAQAAGVGIELLTRRDKGKAREAALQRLASGESALAVGTHALFQQEVAFHDLGLAVIDEQHRFGVHQRLTLASKGRAVDVLVMTATPIPRTLVLTSYGDMDVSRLTEKPAGRQPIDTRAMPLERLQDVIDGVARALQDGAKAYWVCPLVEESEVSDLAAAEARAKELTQLFGAGVGLVHGRMKGKDKDAVMKAFAEGPLSLLVATTVIEVGVDVPAASIMVIEHAERFGLAQLHQLRGRIGRGAARSTCLLLYQGPLGETARSRIQILRETDDGFRIAEEDLRLRGAGELLGTRQSGIPEFRLADLAVHGELLAVARDDARLILGTDSDLTGPRGAALRVLLYLFERDAAVKYLRSG